LARSASSAAFVEVAGEQHPDVPELEAEHHGAPVDRVGGAQRTGLEVKVSKRPTILGLREEGQLRYVAHPSLERTEHLDRDAVLGEEIEGVVGAARQPPELHRHGRLPPLKRLPPHPEVLVHALAGTSSGLSSRPVRIVRPPAFFVGPSCSSPAPRTAASPARYGTPPPGR
jgi:hypothetical protein